MNATKTVVQCCRLSAGRAASMSLKLFCLLVLVTASAAVGQMGASGYNRTSTFTFVSNFANCISTGANNNCWDHTHIKAMNAKYVFFTGGSLWAIDTNGCAYQYTGVYGNTWTAESAMGCSLMAVAHDANGTVYGLIANSNCGSGTGQFEYFTGSSWSPLGGTKCFRQVSVAEGQQNETVIGVDASGNNWNSYNYGSSFTEGSCCFKSAIVLDNLDALFTKTNGTVWTEMNGTWAQLGTLSNASVTTARAVGGLNVYVIGTDKNAYHWNGSSWDKLNSGSSGFSAIAYNGPTRVFAVGALSGGNTVYLFSEQAIRHIRTVTGNSQCPANGCGTAMHTVKVQAGWNGNYDTVHQVTVAPTTQVNLTSTYDLFDPFNCFYQDNPNCIPAR